MTSAQGLPKRVTPQLTYAAPCHQQEEKKKKEGACPWDIRGMGEVGCSHSKDIGVLGHIVWIERCRGRIGVGKGIRNVAKCGLRDSDIFFVTVARPSSKGLDEPSGKTCRCGCCCSSNSEGMR